MGNSQTKEARASSGPHESGSSSPVVRQDAQEAGSNSSNRLTQSSRTRRASRPDFSFLGIGGSSEVDVSTLETRRENKQEREARKLERERAARLKERERSMKEEHVDGGYLVTQGVYVGVEDFNKTTVRQFQIERRLAPFWRGINDFSESWAEHQLMAAARGLPIPPADEVPPELEYKPSKISPENGPKHGRDKSITHLTLPIGSRSQSFQSDSSARLSPSANSVPLPSPISLPGTSSPSTPLFRTRAKTLASLTTSSRNKDQNDMMPREFQLPRDPFINGQPIEVYLYKDASECPICFLYYPPYLNTTRCCEQPICSECFVQIKRPDPHPPEHEQPDPNAPPLSDADREAVAEGLLVSEVATCPYCKTQEFGITYTPPPFRRGLTYGTGSQPFQVMSAMSSQTSVSSSGLSPGPGRRRGTSISANAPEVITTDKIRPDWATKLATARAHAARRAAAATALHTAAYLMNGQPDARAFGPFARRNLIRRPAVEDNNGTSNPHLSALAMLAERHAARQQESNTDEARASPFVAPPRGSSSRRSRMDDLEDMMMMEAIRLSLASEEDRRRREEKEAKKKAKKEEKENKKAEKAARKSSLFTLSSNISNGDGASSHMDRSRSNLSLGDSDTLSSKGKGIERNDSPPEGSSKAEEGSQRLAVPGMSLPETSQESLASSIPIPSGAEPFKRSHLRQMSTASSASSSFQEPGFGASFSGSSTPPTNLEPMFNFRSLAAMIGNEEKGDSVAHVEDLENEGLNTAENDSEKLTLGDIETPLSVDSGEISPSQSKQNSGEKRDQKQEEAVLQESLSAAGTGL